MIIGSSAMFCLMIDHSTDVLNPSDKHVCLSFTLSLNDDNQAPVLPYNHVNTMKNEFPAKQVESHSVNTVLYFTDSNNNIRSSDNSQKQCP